MNDLKYSKKQLLEQIEVLQILNKQILEEKHQAEKLEFAWSGNLGHWYFHLKTKTVIFNPLKIQVLGYTQEELPDRITYNFFTDKLHPEDYGKTMLAMKLCMEGKTEIYECEYRIQDKNGNYKWFYDRGKITQWDDHGNPILVAGIVFDITERKMQEQLLTDKTEQLEVLSSTDVLTGIHNRRSIMEILALKIKQANSLKFPLSVAIFDIDLFKKSMINMGINLAI